MPRIRSAGRFLFGLMLVIALTAHATTAHAAAINYGDFSDIPPGSVMYLDVTESSGTDAAPLFSAPSITEDTLDFDPKGFVAFAGSAGSDITDGQLNFSIMSAPGTGISSILFSEGGDFSLLGTGSAATMIAGGISVRVEIIEVDGVALPSPIDVLATVSFTANLASSPTALSPWANTLFVDFGPSLVNVPHNLGVTKANVVLDDLLVAISEPLSTALIAKKDFTIIPTIEGDNIPEPASLGLFMLGAACVIRRGNR
ncbi:MAG: PEP-CTERM sorting domain-containing protein [Phycisphaerales bacterium]